MNKCLFFSFAKMLFNFALDAKALPYTGNFLYKLLKYLCIFQLMEFSTETHHHHQIDIEKT
jgi:hypothetical protein